MSSAQEPRHRQKTSIDEGPENTSRVMDIILYSAFVVPSVIHASSERTRDPSSTVSFFI